MAAANQNSAAANQFSATTSSVPEICWKRNQYSVPEPQVVSFEEFNNNIHEKVNIAGAKADATDDEKKMLDNLEAIILEWATQMYYDGVPWDPASLKLSDKTAIYILCYLNSGGFKFGMSFRAWLRVKEQDMEDNPIQFGAKLFDAKQVESMVPQHIVDLRRQMWQPYKQRAVV